MIKPPRAEVSPRKDSQCGPSVDSRSALAHSRTVRAVFPRLFMLVAVATASCTMMVDRPKTFTGDERVTGIGYSAAVDYLNDTNKLFQKRLKSLDSFDLTSKGGVGLGVGGAGISAVFRSGIDTILGFVTFGALNYATNQLIDPKSLGDVFSAGLSNLDCIDAAGAVAFQTTNAIRPTLPDIRSRLGAAIAGLQRDKALAGNNSIYAADITAADASIGPANKAAATIDSYYSGSNVGEAMVAAINATITAVNQQVRAKSPNIDSIAQSGAIFSSFINANTNLRAQTQTAIQQASKGFVAQGAADHEGLPAAVIRGDAAIRLALKYCVRVDRRQTQVAREAERPPAWQQDAIPRAQANNAVGNALDSQPALAGNHGIAFDTFMLREPDGNVARIEAAGLVTARFQQR